MILGQQYELHFPNLQKDENEIFSLLFQLKDILHVKNSHDKRKEMGDAHCSKPQH